MNAGPGTHLFIADLHLDPLNRRVSELATRFLRRAEGCEHLFILGDLFEYWLGDDAGLPLYASFMASLRHLSDTGCAVTVMLGNRDFLLGQAFAEASGSSLLSADEQVIMLDGQRILLMHGDTLCSDDVDYQRFRKNVREPRWKQQFLAKNTQERREHAEALRAASHDASIGKPAVIMDVNEATVTGRMLDTHCNTLIHGHTHRPSVHRVSGIPGGQRLVVGDWHDDHAQYIQWDRNGTEAGGFSLKTFR